MQTMDYKFLRFTDFKSIFQWDLKRYLNKSFKSKYSIVALETIIEEESNKYAISEPGKQYGILGVNNQTGIFDAYLEDGARIKQKYKKMKTGWIAYNPYRVNVGSIGIKIEEHKYEYISPAYVVFRCKSSLLPEYLFLTMKTPTFNKIIKDSTTGSVRQNLSFDTLKELTIPLPSVTEQEALVIAYKEKMQQAMELEEQASQIEKEIEEYLLSELNISITKAKLHKGLNLIRFKDVERWDCYNGGYSIATSLKQSPYPIVEIGKVFDFTQRRWDKKEKVFNYVEIGAVDPLKGIMYTEEIQTTKAPSRATQTIKTGDLIVGTTRPYLKKFAIVGRAFENCVCSSGFQVIAPKDEYSLSYLYEYLKSSVAIAQFELFMSGALYPAITVKDLKKILIPLPPVEVQNSIVDHIDKQKEQMKQMKQQAEELRKKALEEFEKKIFE